MSQFNIKKGRRTFQYGFDRILGEYFYAWLINPMSAIDSSLHTGETSASSVLQAAERHGVELPKEHRAALILDLPI